MAIFHDSEANSQLFEKHEEILSNEKFNEYIEKFGMERAIGYMQAMRDFNQELKTIFGGGYAHDGWRRTDAKIRKYTIELFHDNDELLNAYVLKFGKTDGPEV